MPPAERDRTILEHMIEYCNDVQETVCRFGDSWEVFASDKIYKNACALCILQIGELAGHLTEDFRKEHTEMPWNEIKAMRNVVAHAYGSISVKTTWETIKYDLPTLKLFCERVLGQH